MVDQVLESSEVEVDWMALIKLIIAVLPEIIDLIDQDEDIPLDKRKS